MLISTSKWILPILQLPRVQLRNLTLTPQWPRQILGQRRRQNFRNRQGLHTVQGGGKEEVIREVEEEEVAVIRGRIWDVQNGGN